MFDPSQMPPGMPPKETKPSELQKCGVAIPEEVARIRAQLAFIQKQMREKNYEQSFVSSKQPEIDKLKERLRQLSTTQHYRADNWLPRQANKVASITGLTGRFSVSVNDEFLEGPHDSVSLLHKDNAGKVTAMTLIDLSEETPHALEQLDGHRKSMDALAKQKLEAGERGVKITSSNKTATEYMSTYMQARHGLEPEVHNYFSIDSLKGRPLTLPSKFSPSLTTSNYNKNFHVKKILSKVGAMETMYKELISDKSPLTPEQRKAAKTELTNLLGKDPQEFFDEHRNVDALKQMKTSDLREKADGFPPNSQAVFANFHKHYKQLDANVAATELEVSRRQEVTTHQP